MVLADTSVWVDHLRRGNGKLSELLLAGDVACHPFVIGELACGSIGNRRHILGCLQALVSLPKAEDDEVLLFIERRGLMQRGLGLIDVHLLASAALSGVFLWTLDVRLRRAAKDLGISVR
jgi:predicted nucleic acid-binding protein